MAKKMVTSFIYKKIIRAEGGGGSEAFKDQRSPIINKVSTSTWDRGGGNHHPRLKPLAREARESIGPLD